MTAYYNEIDPYAAQWLRNLIKAGHIADGEVDTRSIIDVRPDDLREFTQCHFFAGIAGWSYALRLAGWPDNRQIWTGSCPCQPFSAAGKGKGTDDPRHLWPDFFRLIRSCRPPVVMGEQVAGAAGYGWLDGVRSDLESESYAIEGVDIPACSANAPHIRQRLFWAAKEMGFANSAGWQERKSAAKGMGHGHTIVAGSGDSRINKMDDAKGIGQEHREPRCRDEGANEIYQWRQEEIGAGCSLRDMAISDIHGHDGAIWNAAIKSSNGKNDRIPVGSCGDVWSDRHWHDAIWLNGADGKARRVKPGVRLLAHGISSRMGKLRAYGNAIVPQIAAEVISSFMDTEGS